MSFKLTFVKVAKFSSKKLMIVISIKLKNYVPIYTIYK